MKRYEYDVIDLRTYLNKYRIDNPRPTVGDGELVIEYVNSRGRDGWRVMNNPNEMVVYFERELTGKDYEFEHKQEPAW